MDFFSAQERSRRQTRWLIVLFLIATVAVAAAVASVAGLVFYGASATSIAAQPTLDAARWRVIGIAGAVTLGFIALASLYRIATLRSGGARIARELGGSLVPGSTRDPLQRRLLNVVEEMAIASGVPVPDVYVLENEAGINAFAAGFHPEDAIVAVTRGTLERLDRDELQGVVAHEFSHILNGDMRLNIRLMGPLFGILALGLIGRMMVRGGRYGRWRLVSGSRRSSNGSGLLALGVCLIVIGSIGMFMARLIKAGVSRQREYLADASAVQFTRQNTGIAGALKKIAGFQARSYLRDSDAEEVSHMLFATGIGRLSRMFATHPPLLDRIQKLEPNFSPEELGGLIAHPGTLPDAPGAAAFAGDAQSLRIAERFSVTPSDVADSVGNPNQDDVRIAHDIYTDVSDDLIEAAHSSEGAFVLAVALILHRENDRRSKQLGIVAERLGTVRADRCATLYASSASLGARFRLPLLDLAFPALRRRPVEQLDYLLDLIHRLIDSDAATELFEYSIARTLEYSLQRLRAPAARPRGVRLGSTTAARAIRSALGLFALLGHDDAEVANRAYVDGLGHLTARQVSSDDCLPTSVPADWIDPLDRSIDVLRRLRSTDQRRLVEALTITAAADGQVTVAESELLRVFCAALSCPLPPLYATNPTP